MYYKRNLALEYRLRKLEQLIDEKVDADSLNNVPKYFYHGTSAKYIDSILSKGIRVCGASANHSLSDTSKVYLTSSLHLAKSWAEMANQEDYVVFQVESKYLNLNLLTGDANVDRIDDDGYYDTIDFDDDDKDKYDPFGTRLNLRFDKDGMSDYADFEYAGNIPPNALTVVYRSDKNAIIKATKLLKDKNYIEIFDHWDEYKDITVSQFGDLTVANSIANSLSNTRDIDIILKVPAKVLNTPLDDKTDYKWHKTFLTKAISFIQFMSPDEILDTFIKISHSDKIDDESIKIIWVNYYTKQKQAKTADRMSELSNRALIIGKPYIAKKYHAQLGI